MQRADKKSKYEQNKKDRKAEAAAYQQSRIDMANHRRKMGSSAERKVDQRAHYEHMKRTREATAETKPIVVLSKG